jgi:hypothetical protein
MWKRLFHWMQEPAGGYRGVTALGGIPFPAQGGTCFCDICGATPGQLEQTPSITPDRPALQPCKTQRKQYNSGESKLQKKFLSKRRPVWWRGFAPSRRGGAPPPRFPAISPSTLDGTEEKSKAGSVEISISTSYEFTTFLKGTKYEIISSRFCP